MAVLHFRETGYRTHRVMGMAGVLGRHALRTSCRWNSSRVGEDIQCLVLGGHGDSMVPLAALHDRGRVRSPNS